MKLRRPGPRLTAGLLIASLCLNLFAVGAFGAALIWRDEHRGPGFGLVERAPDDARTVLRHLFAATTSARGWTRYGRRAA